jgi:hypothetical protein
MEEVEECRSGGQRLSRSMAFISSSSHNPEEEMLLLGQQRGRGIG